ncbi:Polyphosphoinositide phosphatase, factor-induced gene 4 [Dissoconium aciculare CBS 342.82]|uniref:Polyphosphoinositide phosphatase, factor-induced gene 4 n=1 Tax=Dissoconium aciculare CBS 342.82 TaxID=1314786 RepID=A0A6J3M128_9PEZI|nr:Polyphosphoinositide phosphatase, factor-induced gene 4 [Dissoconium aciculare CBS 342.82]KAF1821726.1 Polyphosphoinositide phosphatase, factor-induced gene 4 [Dissoconium aciculare CBS 342.82]
MENGPIDAGPPDESDGAPGRTFLPSDDRPDSQGRSVAQDPSVRKVSAPDEPDGSYDDELKTDDYDKSQGPDAIARDLPMFTRVGATKEEIAGIVSFEDDEHLKTKSFDVREVENGHSHPHRMYKFTLYETNARYWITGADITDKSFRMLRIDRTSAPGQIALFEDETVYDRDQLNDVLTAIDQGNKATNGLRKKYSFWGILGFIRFTEAYYMLLITKRKQVAMIGGHYVYQIESTEMVPLSTGSSSSFLRDRNPEEARFLSIMNNVDLSKSFYFSYTYDITHSLQNNIIRMRNSIHEGHHHATSHDYNGMFVWNNHLLKPAVQALKHPYDWCQPIIHGFLDQASLDIFGRTVYVTIIGRRSRFFAGARFLKRGINDLGYVANDVETEQIVAEKVTTSFHAPGLGLYANPTYTSYLHHRGSIPLYWSQDSSGVTPKPAIDVHLNDPYYVAAAQHFDNLFERYGGPVYALNLVKQKEKVPRESKLLDEYKKCLDYLNSSLPGGKKIIYEAYDMSRAAKTRSSNVISGLETIARAILDRTGFFHNGDEDAQLQNGIARTNCIDCLDRTNAAQFVIGKHAFALQLRALGVITSEEIAYDTDAINLFTGMFHDHGDNIAMQYAGSHLVNTMATYRKLSHWQSSSRDMVESFKRYYHNSFLDSQRQEAYNLFLGNYVWAQGQPMLWDLSTDYHLHHSDPRGWLERHRRKYTDWYTPEFIEPRTMPAAPRGDQALTSKQCVPEYDDYWRECYRPTALSSLQKVYSYKVSSMPRFLHDRTHSETKYDFSPFVPRVDPHKHQQHHQNGSESPNKKPAKKGVKIIAPQEELNLSNSPALPVPPSADTYRGPAPDEIASILRGSVYDRPNANAQRNAGPPVRPADKGQMHLWTLNQFHTQSLNPHVPEHEAWEYERYIAHPLNLPLVVSSEDPSDANIDFVEYVHKAGGMLYRGSADDEEGVFAAGIRDADLQAYWNYVEDVPDDPLTVFEDDLVDKKRYKAYRQWLKGKSLFKQSKVDPEYRSA